MPTKTVTTAQIIRECEWMQEDYSLSTSVRLDALDVADHVRRRHPRDWDESDVRSLLAATWASGSTGNQLLGRLGFLKAVQA